MRIALASAEVRDRDLAFNLEQVEQFLYEAQALGVDLLCFGEAYLQGFDALDWRFETDRQMALSLDADPLQRLRSLNRQTGVDLLLPFLELDGDAIYSSCVLLSGGSVLHHYRRISRGWKVYWKTDGHYREGTEVRPFSYRGKTCLVALCGDLWDETAPRFRQDADLLLWPVYISYTPEEWQRTAQAEYASRAAAFGGDVLLINALCGQDAHGGSCHFRNGYVLEAQPMDQEGLLLVEI